MGVLAVGFAAPATANAGILDSVQGWWPMYEGSGQTIHDLSGKGNNGTLGTTPGVDANDPTWIKGFLFGSALRFDGNDVVRIPDSASLRPAKLTLSAWVRGNESPGKLKYVVGKGARECYDASYGLYTSDTAGLRFYVTDDNGAYHASGSPDQYALWNGKWHHVAGTYDGVDAKLYVDGKLQTGAPESPAASAINYDAPTTGDAGFGGYLGTCDLYYTGDIDDVALFKEALPVDKYWAALSLLFPKPLR